MGKRILTTWAASGQPFRAPTSLDHLQDNVNEAVRQSLIKAIGATYDNTKVYRIWGCKLQAPTGMLTPITEGAVLYMGEIYLSPAQAFTTPTGGDVVVAAIQKTYAGGDPTTFKDGSTHNVHEIRTFTYFGAASGSTIANVSDFITIGGWISETGLTFSAPAGGSVTVDPGDITYSRYRFDGSTLFYQLVVTNATVGASTAAIKIQMPFMASNFAVQGMAFMGSYNGTMQLQVILTNDYLLIGNNAGGYLTAGTNNQSFTLNIVAEVL